MHFCGKVYALAMIFWKKKTVRAEFVPVILPDPVQPEAPEEIATSSENTVPRKIDAPRKKVLVVDDDPVVVKTLWLKLNARGYHVLCASDAAQAIKLVREQDPDILLVDVGLPPDIAMGGANLTDGFQVTRWLQLANTRKIPSIIISGSDKPTYRRQAAAVGADGFLPKPINEDALMDSIECALAMPAPVAEGFATFKMAATSFAD
jgi:twitching motility two-component system response regulator PilH